eukprot:2927127-Rhodomonas_salina.4
MLDAERSHRTTRLGTALPIMSRLARALTTHVCHLLGLQVDGHPLRRCAAQQIRARRHVVLDRQRLLLDVEVQHAMYLQGSQGQGIEVDRTSSLALKANETSNAPSCTSWSPASGANPNTTTYKVEIGPNDFFWVLAFISVLLCWSSPYGQGSQQALSGCWH